MGDEFKPSELTDEKNLWQIYKKSRRIEFSRFNFFTTVFIFFILVLQVFIGNLSVSETLVVVRKWAEFGITISFTTIGLLLAGFTIFSTVTQPSLSLEMAQMKDPETGLSYLKKNYFIFIRVFIYYLSFLVFCFLVISIGHSGGLLSELSPYMPHYDEIRFFLVKSSYVIIFTGYYFLIMQLKSFVFNVYHAVMTSIRWRAEGWDQ